MLTSKQMHAANRGVGGQGMQLTLMCDFYYIYLKNAYDLTFIFPAYNEWYLKGGSDERI
jgi:hypothetical protein